MELVAGAANLPYDSPQPPPAPELASLIDRMKNEESGLLLGCDANSHHISWGSTDTNGRTDSLNEFIMSENLLVSNRGSELTFKDARRQKVLDITICSVGLSSCEKNWRVSKNLQARITVRYV